MPRIQIVYATRHGATTGIARRIGEVLRDAGAEVEVVDAATHPDAHGFDAYVIGSAIYMGSWLKPGIEYLDRNQLQLAARPVWLFSSGPLPDEHMPLKDSPMAHALGPADGPGSGGRKRITALANAIRVRDHRVFDGAYNPADPPQTLIERIALMLPAVKNVLPTGDFRPWADIDAWAKEIAGEVVAPVAV